MKTAFETETCSRCGGTGEYSSCETHGTRCFKCGGARVTYTKRGGAARNYLRELCSVNASEVVAGDRISDAGRRLTVLSVSQSVQVGSSNGVPYSAPCIILRCKGISLQFLSDSKVVKLATQEKIDQAVAYQATLTKEGHVRKGAK